MGVYLCRMERDIQAIHAITKVSDDDIDVISEKDRIYVVYQILDQLVLDQLEEEGYLIDVDECPFGWCTIDDDIKTGIDAHCVIYR